MEPKKFAKEIPLYRRTGTQECYGPERDSRRSRRVTDHAQIKEWLIGGQKPSDFEGGLEFPKTLPMPRSRSFSKRGQTDGLCMPSPLCVRT